MNPVQELIEVQERLYVRRDELARAPAPAAKKQRPDPRELAHVERALGQIEAGLYPACEVCGERIEIDRLRAEPFTLLCQSCARAARNPAVPR